MNFHSLIYTNFITKKWFYLYIFKKYSRVQKESYKISRMKVKKEELVSFLLLIFASFLWGISFVFQSMASNHLGTFSINTFRSLIAALFLLPIALYSIYKSRKENKQVNYKISIIGGVFAGFFLALASIFSNLAYQQLAHLKADLSLLFI